MELVKEAARIADGEKGEEIQILDVSEVCNICETFILISGRTRAHLRAIGEKIEEMLKRDYQVRCFAAVGYGETDWVVLDFNDFVIHIFTTEARGYYGLERLWGDAPVVEWQAGAVQN